MLRARTWTSTQHPLRALLRTAASLDADPPSGTPETDELRGRILRRIIDLSEPVPPPTLWANSAALPQCDAFRHTKRSLIAANSRFHGG